MEQLPQYRHLGVQQQEMPEAAREDARSSRRGWQRPALALAVALAIAVAATTIMMHPPRAPPRSASVGEDVTSLASASYSALQSCYGYTGGRCRAEQCLPSRGATCENSMCICESGCAGADGKCYRVAANTLVASNFILTNVHWTSYAMYFQAASLFGQLSSTRLATWANREKDKFTLYKLPQASQAEPTFLLGSVRWTDRIARVDTSGLTSLSRYGFYATDLAQGRGIDKLAVYVCHDKEDGALRIADQERKHWVYLHDGTWVVVASSWNETQAARSTEWRKASWRPEPAFTPEQVAMLPEC